MLRASSRLLLTLPLFAPTIPTRSFALLHRQIMTSSTITPPAPFTVQAIEELPQNTVNELYRPFLQTKNAPDEAEWVDQLELDQVTEMASRFPRKLKILILYGSLRVR